MIEVGVTSAWTLAAGGTPGAAQLALIVVLGVIAQWVAWRLRVPSILLLLMAGLLAGPVMRQIAPDTIFAIDPEVLLGNLLMPLVGMAVGLILYEGGLTLSFHEVRPVRRTVALLVTVGALTTWVIAALAASLLLDVSIQIAVLLGAILLVTGPTVIGPMIDHIRPTGVLGPILRWEGIIVDPIGMTMAVLVFEVVRVGQIEQAAPSVVRNILLTVVVGGGLGGIAAILLLRLMTRFLVPDFLQNPVSLMLVVATFVLANGLEPESGLLATIVMGVVVANQTKADVRHILEFKENLRVLLLSALFVVLGASLEVATMKGLNWFAVAGFIIILVVVARPIGIAISTIGSGLSLRERVFLSLVAPRGVVAAAGASVFSLALQQEVSNGALQLSGVGKLVPVTFATIIATVGFYGLVAPIAARRLGVSDENPQGILFIGASPWVRSVATALKKYDVNVLLVDTNRINVRAAKMEHLPAWQGSILAEYALREIDLRGIGRVVAVTSNEEVNALALQRLAEQFDTAGLYSLPLRVPKKKDDQKPVHAFGRHLFADGLDLETIESRFEHGWIIKATTLSQEFSYEDWRMLYGPKAVVMFVISPAGVVHIATAGRDPVAEAGATIVGLVNPDELIFA